MKRLRSNLFYSLLSLTAVLLFAVPQSVTSALAEGGAKTFTEIIHRPMDYFVPQKRIRIEATVTDKFGVNLVRCYFRAVEEEDYVFVAMSPVFGSFIGILPAPSKETEMVQYLFLVVNGRNQVVRTQTFEIRRKDKDEAPAWQQVSSEGEIRVITELAAQAPKAPTGFTDTIAMDVVASYSRFGFVVGGIYTSRQIASAGGAIGIAAVADDGGTVSAKKGRRSTLTYVGIGAALLAGGAIAAGGGGGGGGGGQSATTSSTTTSFTTTVPPTTTSTTTAPTTAPTTTSTTTIPLTTTSSTTTAPPECAPPASWEAYATPVCPHDSGSTLPYIVIVDVGTPDRLVFYRFSGGFVIQPRSGEGYQYSSSAGRITFGLSVWPVGSGTVTVYVEIAECEGRPHREWRLQYPDAFPPCN